MDPVTRHEIRRKANEIKTLRHNMFAIAKFTQEEWSTMLLGVYLELCDRLDTIVAQLEERYHFVFDTLAEYNLAFLWPLLGIFE